MLTIRRRSFDTVVSIRISSSVKKQINNICDEKKISRPEWIRALIYRQLKEESENYEIYDDVERILEIEDVFNQSMTDNRYRDMLKEIQTSSIREKTVLKYLDRQLASIYIRNRDYFEESELENMLKDHVEAFKKRCEMEGFKDRWELRKDKPIKYAKDELERRATEKDLEL